MGDQSLSGASCLSVGAGYGGPSVNNKKKGKVNSAWYFVESVAHTVFVFVFLQGLQNGRTKNYLSCCVVSGTTQSNKHAKSVN